MLGLWRYSDEAVATVDTLTVIVALSNGAPQELELLFDHLLAQHLVQVDALEAFADAQLFCPSLQETQAAQLSRVVWYAMFLEGKPARFGESAHLAESRHVTM